MTYMFLYLCRDVRMLPYVNVCVYVMSASPGKCAPGKTGVSGSTVTPNVKFCYMACSLNTPVPTQLILTQKI